MKNDSILKKLFDYAGPYRYLTIASWVLSGISALVALAPFVFIWRIIDEVLAVAPNYGNAVHIVENGWLALGFAVLTIVVYLCALMCSHIAAFRVQRNMRTRTMAHIITLPLGVLGEMGSGKLRKTVDECSAATETYLAHQMPDRAGAFVTPIGLLVMLLVFDWCIGLLSLIPVVVAFAVMGLMTGKRMEEKMKQYNDALDDMSNEAVEYIRGIPVVKTFGQTVFSFKRFKESIDRYETWVISYTKELRMPMMLYTVAINAVFAVLIAAGLVMTQDGVTSAFLTNVIFYIIITPIITVTLNKIMYGSEEAMIVRDALGRVEEITSMVPLLDAVNPQHPSDASIEFADVSFAYCAKKKKAVDSLSLRIPQGSTVALVGPSGDGKTTIASLAARFYDVDAGSVKVGGIDVRDIAKRELMETVSFVFQDSRLLKGTILDNVRLGRKDATREQVMRALTDAQCANIIEKFPDGLDTVIGSAGVYLSGGEQQRIAIARAFLKEAPILVLDEATAFADPDNEEAMRLAFERLAQGKTVLKIAHRLSTVADADAIAVIRDGCVAEMGTHAELVGKGALYAQMWSQYQQSVQWNLERKAV